MAVRPGGEYAGRPLNIIWLLDCSGSMAEFGKIEALNNSIREVIPAMRKAAEGNPEVQFFVRVIRFSSGASWHVGTPTPLADFKWVDLKAEGETDMGQAFALLAEDFRKIPDNTRALPPQLVLVSDGKPTDDWKGALQALFEIPWGKRAVRQAIAIGQDADHETLKKFIDNVERPVLRADNAEQLVRYFRYVSTAVAGAAPGRQPAPAPVAAAEAFDDSAW
ncbi:MAG TPA: VWA domain-containing protein [Acidobacteriaceae bacterium]|nr:VWA domain-containing protein [Acidobacteriaceae bacterium]